MSGFHHVYPDLSSEDIKEDIKTATLKDLEKIYESSYEDLENITYYFPKKITEEVPGEQIMIMTQEEREYYNKCLEYIFYARQIPTEEEKDMVISEAKEILDVEDVIASILLVDNLRIQKN